MKINTSKIGKLSSLAALGTCLLFSARAWAAGAQDFTLHNDTKLTINELYISPHDEESWEEDVLGVDVLEDGDETEISFDPKEDAESWDIKIVDENGKGWFWKSVKLTEITDITLFYKDGKPYSKTKNGG